MVMTGPRPAPEEAASAAAASASLRSEASSVLTAAGQRFRALAQRSGRNGAGPDPRALINWGRALCVRARLADNPEVRTKCLPCLRMGCGIKGVQIPSGPH